MSFRHGRVLYRRLASRFVATELARGPVGPETPSTAARPRRCSPASSTAACPDPALRLGAVTYEFLRPVPLGELSVSDRDRPARHARAAARGVASRRRRHRGGPRPGAALGAPRGRRPGADAAAVPAPRTVAATTGSGRAGRCSPPDAIEIRFVEGALRRAGPGDRLVSPARPLIAGEADRRCSGMAAAADFPNGIASSSPGTSMLHQPRPDALHRARAGRRVGRAAGADARRRRAASARRRERALRRRGPDRPRAPVAAGDDRPRPGRRRHFSRKALIRTSYCCASRA